MRAVFFDENLRFAPIYPIPQPGAGDSRIRVLMAGICKTDLEILKGYAGFCGILGHEFVGVVEESDDPRLVGKRVAGEINIGCGKCRHCETGMARHCPDRRVLGIRNYDGCMADFCVLPNKNLVEIPDGISDRKAVFIEPLSAACRILEQTAGLGAERAVILGDGRIGILCAWVLSTSIPDVTILGRHRKKLRIAEWLGLKTGLNPFEILPEHGAASSTDKRVAEADLVVEASGAPGAIAQALKICAPQGVIVLKTTTARAVEIDLSPVVIREQTIVGSRCGRFADGLRFLRDFPDVPVERLVTKTFELEDAVAAFESAEDPESLKILFEMRKR